MSVTVDQRPLPVEELGLNTVGEVLSHLQKAGGGRLVVHVLIDGQEPDLARLPTVKKSPLKGHTLYIETAEPRQMAREVLTEVEGQLGEAERLKNEAAELLQQNLQPKAMEKLSGCFSTWQHAQESILKTAQLLRIDLGRVQVEGKSMSDTLQQFTATLKDIRTALEDRDFVRLTDILRYETSETCASWRAAIQSMRAVIA